MAPLFPTISTAITFKTEAHSNFSMTSFANIIPLSLSLSRIPAVQKLVSLVALSLEKIKLKINTLRKT